jgi:hypothetical protein
VPAVVVVAARAQDQELFSRGDPIASLAAASLIAFVLYRFWVRVGRPRGIAEAVVEAEG